MRYTRYDLRKKKNNNFIIIFLTIGILLLAFICGSLISKLFIKNINNGDSNINKNPDKIVQPIGDKNFVVIQCGVFANKENAEKMKERLSSLGNPFITEEDGKSRVILGIYSEKDAENIAKKLQDENMDFSKISYKFNSDNPSVVQAAEILDAHLEIINKLSEANVKSVATKQIKEWCSNLDKINSNDGNLSILKDMKEYISNLPKEITKEDLEEYDIYVYKKLIELKI